MARALKKGFVSEKQNFSLILFFSFKLTAFFFFPGIAVLFFKRWS